MKKKTKKRLKIAAIWLTIIALGISLVAGILPQKQTTITDPELLEQLIGGDKENEEELLEHAPEPERNDVLFGEKEEEKDEGENEKYEPQKGLDGYYRIKEIVDGNTLIVTMGEEEKTLSLIGVEIAKGMEDEAVKFLKKETAIIDLVSLEFDEKTLDKDGNLLGYVYHPKDINTSLNVKLLAAGYAKLAENKENVKHIEDLRSAEDTAKKEKVGCWAES